jgi:hypothetical protein
LGLDRVGVLTREIVVALVVRAVRRGVDLVVWVVAAVPLLAASPSPSAAPGGDPRSSGQGPGLVGEPLIALVGVLGIGLGALVLTLVYIRLTARPPR